MYQSYVYYFIIVRVRFGRSYRHHLETLVIGVFSAVTGTCAIQFW